MNKKRSKIRINAQIVFDIERAEYVAIMDDRVYSKARFFYILETDGTTVLRCQTEFTKVKYYGSVLCPDARFIKVLLNRLNYGVRKNVPQLIIKKFNESFPDCVFLD